jgi:hypothetical protein
MSEAAEDARRWGLPDEVAAALEEGPAADGEQVGIWPENMDIVSAFQAVSSQWRAAGMADGRLHYIGLDYAGASAGLNAAGIALTSDQWHGLRVMEGEARAALNGVSG